MSYNTIATIAEDLPLQRRVTACAAVEGETEPETWAQEHRWQMASQPGWDVAWESAAANPARPNTPIGADEAVITDSMILSAVQAVRG